MSPKEIAHVIVSRLIHRTDDTRSVTIQEKADAPATHVSPGLMDWARSIDAPLPDVIEVSTVIAEEVTKILRRADVSVERPKSRILANPEHKRVVYNAPRSEMVPSPDDFQDFVRRAVESTEEAIARLLMEFRGRYGRWPAFVHVDSERGFGSDVRYVTRATAHDTPPARVFVYEIPADLPVSAVQDAIARAEARRTSPVGPWIELVAEAIEKGAKTRAEVIAATGFTDGQVQVAILHLANAGRLGPLNEGLSIRSKE